MEAILCCSISNRSSAVTFYLWKFNYMYDLVTLMYILLLMCMISLGEFSHYAEAQCHEGNVCYSILFSQQCQPQILAPPDHQQAVCQENQEKSSPLRKRIVGLASSLGHVHIGLVQEECLDELRTVRKLSLELHATHYEMHKHT